MGADCRPKLAGRVVEAVGGALSVCTIAYYIIRSTPVTRKDLQNSSRVKLAALATYWACGLLNLWLCVSLWAAKPDFDEHSCRVVYFGTTFLHLAAKPVMYYFYLERVLLSYHLTAKHKRLVRIGSVISLFMTCGGLGVGLAISPHAKLAHDGSCLIGLPETVGIVSDILDGGLEVSLTALFIWPVIHAKFPDARALALRSALACVATSLASVAMFSFVVAVKNNLMTVWLYNGGWLVIFTINATVVFIITNPNPSKSPSVHHLEIPIDVVTKVSTSDPRPDDRNREDDEEAFEAPDK